MTDPEYTQAEKCGLSLVTTRLACNLTGTDTVLLLAAFTEWPISPSPATLYRWERGEGLSTLGPTALYMLLRVLNDDKELRRARRLLAQQAERNIAIKAARERDKRLRAQRAAARKQAAQD